MPAFPKIFTSFDFGAPTLNNTAGSLIGVLDACLLTGYGLRTFGAITQTGGVATANVGSNHGLLAGQVLLITGANESAYNGEFKILNTGFNTIQFAVPVGAPASATGTIQFKLAPLDWAKPFSATNIGVYRTKAVTNTVGCYLRVDDSANILSMSNKTAQVMGYESMTDVNTGAGRFPQATQALLNWSKADAGSLNGYVRHWCIFGDDRLFYYWVAPSYGTAATSLGTLFGFGDIDVLPGSLDSFGCLISGNIGDLTSLASTNSNCLSYMAAGTKAGCFAPRPPQGVGTPPTLGTASAYINSHSGFGAYITANFPNPADNGVVLMPVFVIGSSAYRGAMPGYFAVPQTMTTSSVATAPYASFQIVDGTRNMLGRKLMFLGCGGATYTQAIGAGIFVDVLGPFRQYN